MSQMLVTDKLRNCEAAAHLEVMASAAEPRSHNGSNYRVGTSYQPTRQREYTVKGSRSVGVGLSGPFPAGLRREGRPGCPEFFLRGGARARRCCCASSR